MAQDPNFDHGQSPRLGQRQAPSAPGVQLCTEATLPEIAYNGQIVYMLDKDQFRVYDTRTASWHNPTAASYGGTQTFVSATQPVADATGDLWMDTSTSQLYVWDGTQWGPAEDPSAANAASLAQAKADTALGIAQDQFTTYYSSTAPASPAESDMWVDTVDNTVWRYIKDGTGTLSWIEITDSAVSKAIKDAGNAQSTADGKIVTHQGTYASRPMTGNAIGDLFIATDDKMHPYRWNGGPDWVDIRDATIVDAHNLANSKSADFYMGDVDANGNPQTPTATGVGDLWHVTNQGNLIKYWTGSAWINLPLGMTALDQNDVQSKLIISASQLVTGTLDASQQIIVGDQNAGAIVLGPDPRSGSDTLGIWGQSDPSTMRLELPVDPAQRAVFRGDAEIDNLTVNSKLTVNTQLTMAQGQNISLSTVLQPPSAAPTVSSVWSSSNWTLPDDSWAHRLGPAFYAASSHGVVYLMKQPNNGEIDLEWYNTATGVRQGTTTVLKITPTQYNWLTPFGCTVANGILYVGYYNDTNDTDNYVSYTLNATDGTPTKANTWADANMYGSNAVLVNRGSGTTVTPNPVSLCWDGTLATISGVANTPSFYAVGTDSSAVGSTTVVMNKVSLPVGHAVVGGTGNVSSAGGLGTTNGIKKAIYRNTTAGTGGDATANRFLFCNSNANTLAYVTDTSGNWQTAEYFDLSPTQSMVGFWWDGTNYWSLDNAGVCRKHEADASLRGWASGSTSGNFYLAYEWSAGGTTQTTRSPSAKLVAKRRARVQVTTPALPPSSTALTGVRIVGTRTTDPGTTTTTQNMYEQGGTAVDFGTTATLTALASTGTLNKATNAFATGTPAQVRNDTGTLIIDASNGITTPKLTNSGQTYYSCHLTANVAITSGSFVAVAFNSVDNSHGTDISYSTTTGVFTINTTGYYLFTVHLNFIAGIGTQYARLNRNNAASIFRFGPMVTASSVASYVSGSVAMVLNANDTITVEGYSTATSPSLIGDANRSTVVSVTRLT